HIRAPSPAADPATSLLSPYTTLFRSPARFRAGDRGPSIRCRRRLWRYDRWSGTQHRADAGRDGEGSWPPVSARDGRLEGEGQRADRKSTRLNSSHGSISYAVFCLKKT